MPVYEVELEDGRIVELEADYEPSESDILAAIGNQPAQEREEVQLRSAESFRTPSMATVGGSSKLSLPSARESFASFLDEAGDFRPIESFGRGMGVAGQALKGGFADAANLLVGGEAITPEDPFENLRAAAFQEPLPVNETIRNLPTGQRMIATAAGSIPEVSPRLAGTAAMSAAGVPVPLAAAANFGVTNEGEVSVKDAAMAAAIPFVGRYGGKIAEAIASKYGVSGERALQAINISGNQIAANTFMAAPQAYEISQLPEDQQRDAWIDMIASNIGQSLLGLADFAPALRQEGAPVGLAREINRAPLREELVESPAIAQRRLGVPLTFEPFLQPGVRELASDAMAEAQSPIFTGGEAQRALREAVEPTRIEEAPTRLSGRDEGGGETLSGRVSFNREAEAPLPERTRNATQDQIPEAAQTPQAEAASEAVAPLVADADLQVSVQSPMKLGDKQMPGYVQVDSVVGGENQWSSNPKKLRDEGYDIPTQEELLTLPQGKYTLEQAKQMLAEKRSSSPVDAAITKIEEWQSKLRSGAQKGDTLMGVPSAILDTALEVARLSLKGGKLTADAINDAIQHIKRNVKSFDEASVRGILEREIGTPTPEAGQSPRMAPPTGVIEPRSLSARGTTAKEIPKPVRAQIKGSPESYYETQTLKGVKGAAREMSDADLGAVGKDSDIYTAAKLEQATRLFDRGESEAGYRVFQDLSAELTRAGQVINQAKLLQALRPEHVVMVVNKELAKGKRDPLTPQQTARMEGLAKERISKQSELNKATDEWLKNPTDENAVKAENALDAANDAAVKEQGMVSQFQPRHPARVLKTILQGNLLTPISQTANIAAPITFAFGRAGSRTIGAAVDAVDSYIRSRPRQISVSPIGGSKAAIEGAVRGAAQIPSILKRGTGETIAGESRAGLHPMRAWVKQLAKNPDVPTVGGRIPFSERLNLLLEGTAGVPAEGMLRMLGAADSVARESNRARIINEQSNLAKLNPQQKRMAQRFPELFFDKATRERMDSETASSVFQRSSKTLGKLAEALQDRPWLDLMVATVAPYKVTPWNIIGEIFSYNPALALANAGYQAKKGNTRAAEMSAGKAVIGSMLIAAGTWLYNKGLIAPSMDTKDEQQKARLLAGEVLPPNHINLSGLDRAMKGEDPTFRAGDETVDIFRVGGLAGSMFYMTANIGRDAETSTGGEDQVASLIKNSTMEQARFGLNQSFVKGVAGTLDVIRGGQDADSYLQSYANTVLSIPLPNTLSALSRASREYKPDFRPNEKWDILRNSLKVKLGNTDDLPVKRGLWGEPLRETPKDSNAYLYQLFDITKNKQVTDDPVALELYRLWRKTADTSIVPTPPGKTTTFLRETYVLSPAQQSKLAELVGRNRREIIEEVVLNPEWHKSDDDEKIAILKKVYDIGSDLGKEAFMSENPELKPKPTKQGFAPLK